MKKWLLCFLLIAAISCGSLFAQDISAFEEEVLLTYTNGNDIYPVFSPNYFPIADMVDWNGDGSFDIILGSFKFGFVDFMPNSGTNESPAFVEEDAEPLFAGGEQISLSYG